MAKGVRTARIPVAELLEVIISMSTKSKYPTQESLSASGADRSLLVCDRIIRSYLYSRWTGG